MDKIICSKCIERIERLENEIKEITEFLHTIFIENEVAVYKGKLECRSKKSIIEKIEGGELENDQC